MDDEITTDIGTRIRNLREFSNLSLEQLASQIGISRQTLSRYETGVISNIPSDRIESLAKALHVTPAYLMGWQNYKTHIETQNEKKRLDKEDSLINYFCKSGYDVYVEENGNLEIVYDLKHYILSREKFEDIYKLIDSYMEFVFSKFLAQCEIIEDENETYIECKKNVRQFIHHQLYKDDSNLEQHDPKKQ